MSFKDKFPTLAEEYPVCMCHECFDIKEELHKYCIDKKLAIERINALEEEFYLTLSVYGTDSRAYKEANRLKMLILKELELI